MLLSTCNWLLTSILTTCYLRLTSESGLSSTRMGSRPCSSASRSLGLQKWKAPEAMKRMWSVLTLPTCSKSSHSKLWPEATNRMWPLLRPTLRPLLRPLLWLFHGLFHGLCYGYSMASSTAYSTASSMASSTAAAGGASCGLPIYGLLYVLWPRLLGRDDRALEQRQEVALHALGGGVRRAAEVAARADLVDLVNEDDSLLLDGVCGGALLVLVLVLVRCWCWCLCGAVRLRLWLWCGWCGWCGWWGGWAIKGGGGEAATCSTACRARRLISSSEIIFSASASSRIGMESLTCEIGRGIGREIGRRVGGRWAGVGRRWAGGGREVRRDRISPASRASPSSCCRPSSCRSGR